jgi:NAD(P)-dependent dehydrogenase (short-subunit alcohol dehydrogenase family)
MLYISAIGTMDKKICVITGATSGIGYGIANGLAAKNFELVLIGRDPRKGQSAVEKLEKETGNSAITYYNTDLCSQTKIRQTGEEIRQHYPRIDVLINNAGVWTSRYELTDDKIETQFAVNHLAYFLLTHILYPSLAQSDNGRIINVGSDSHKFGKINFDDLNLAKSYHGLKAYGQSKLANLLFTYELHRRKKEGHVSVYCVQPGLVKTDIGVKHTNPFHAFMWKLRRLGGMTPGQAALTAIHLASSDEVATASGLYWDRCKPKPSSVRSNNAEDAERLWKMSQDLCGIKNYFPSGLVDPK